MIYFAAIILLVLAIPWLHDLAIGYKRMISPPVPRRSFKDHLVERLPPPPFDHEAAERKLFLEVPSAWWLDPNRWGDNPGWNDPPDRYVYSWERKDAAPLYDPKPAIGAPGCIDCGRSRMEIAAQYGDSIEFWFCPDCGNTMTAREARRRAYEVDLRDLDTPRCFASRPGAQDRAENDCDHCSFGTGCDRASLLPPH